MHPQQRVAIEPDRLFRRAPQPPGAASNTTFTPCLLHQPSYNSFVVRIKGTMLTRLKICLKRSFLIFNCIAIHSARLREDFPDLRLGNYPVWNNE